MRAPSGFGQWLRAAVKCLALLALFLLALPTGGGVSPIHPAYAARQPTAVETYIGNLWKKFTKKKQTTRKTTKKKTPAKKTAKKQVPAKPARTPVAKKPAATAGKAPKPVARPPLPEPLEPAEPLDVAATGSLADTPDPAAPALATPPPAAPPPATSSPAESASATPPPATSSPAVPAPETLLPDAPPPPEPADPRSRKTALGGQTAMLIIPRPRPAFPQTADPQTAEPPSASPLTTNGKWRPEEVRAARLACEVELSGLDVAWKESNPIGGPKGCGTVAPISLKSAAGVQLSPAAIANCRMAATFHRWLETVVQPAAERAFSDRVTGLAVAASYDCRFRYNAAGGKVSEHARANAIDISGFTLASGKKVEVLGGWQPRLVSLNGDAAFLREVHKGGCTMFSTVLGPEANAAHASHFHLDLQPRNRRSRFCE